MGQNFDHYDGLQPKMRAGIINEHECSNVLRTSIDFHEISLKFSVHRNLKVLENISQPISL